jgi:hypothetical protein
MWSQGLNSTELKTAVKFEGAKEGRKSMYWEPHDADVKPNYSVQGTWISMGMGIVE